MKTVTDELFFGLPLTTHRAKEVGPEADYFFLYESAIAGISILFFRSTVQWNREPVALRMFFAVVLAFLAFSKKSYQLIAAVEIFSFVVPLILGSSLPPISSLPDKVMRLLLIALGGILSMIFSHWATSGEMMKLLEMVTPSFLNDIFHVLLPIDEVAAAYNIMTQFQKPAILDKQIDHLLFVTFHIQFGIGYLGIEFLRKEQQRRNELVRMDTTGDSDFNEDGNSKQSSSNNSHLNNHTHSKVVSTNSKMEKAVRFQKGAAPFIIFTAVPYMIQIIFYGNINKFAFLCLQHDMHRTIRLNELFDQDNHLQAMAVESPTSPEAYATSMDVVVETTYEIFNRKLFSLPKVLLLPSVISKTPQMMAQIFPIIFISDWIKGRAITYMTTTVETLQREIQELSAIRSKIEAFDIKNAELLQRSGKGATQFTQKRWEVLTVQIQAKATVSDLIVRTKGFFAWIQRNFVFSVLVDCALANLIAIGKIVSAEIFVFSRAIEDAVDMVLMKSRNEAELARLMTEISKLSELADIWERSNNRNLIHCKLAKREQDGITLRHVHYSRGTATVRAEHVELEPGIYALTGANGSGKSTLFRVLMSCDTNDKSVDLPSSISFSTPSVSLVEKDDLLEDTSCEANRIEDDAVCNNKSGECSWGEDQPTAETAATGLPEGMPVPRLSITMPSSHVVEISQTFYWPLYTKPIDWIYQEHVSEACDDTELDRRLRHTAEELQSMSFFQPMKTSLTEDDSDEKTDVTNGVVTIIEHLKEEKEDWFGDLSGGQRSKAELVRKVFLQEKCPSVVLIDETLAPLDPTSKALVMSKLKDFCKGSIIIVIYHADIGHGQENEEGEQVECVPSSNFFDHNIHLEDQVIRLRPVC